MIDMMMMGITLIAQASQSTQLADYSIGGFRVIDLSASGIVVITVIMILTGKLIPYSTHKSTIEAVEYFKKAHDEERALRIQLASAVSELANKEDVSIKMGKSIIENIPIQGEEGGQNEHHTGTLEQKDKEGES